MIILSKAIEKSHEGSIRLTCDKEDDIYLCYNIISLNDIITMLTSRNVVHESNTGKTEKSKRQFNIVMSIEKFEFDGEKTSIRISGRNTQENDFIKIGQYHSVEIHEGITFKLYKSYWDHTLIKSLTDATNAISNDNIVAIVMQFGLANICLVGPEATITIKHIECNIPKKKQSNLGRDKAIIDFYRRILDGLIPLLEKLKYNTVIVIGSPGFINTEFLNYLFDIATKTENRALLNMRSKIMTCHTSCGYKSAVDEILLDPILQNQVSGLKVFNQVKALELFNQTLEEDENKACYGNKEVEYAVSLKSVQTLLITDTLFRAPDPKLRNQYRNLRNSVIANGGEVLEFSSKHNSGAQLDQYTGIAAILRFPIYDTDIFSNETEKNTKTITNVDTVSTLPIARYEYDEFDEFDELDDVYK